jgi:hypothetical protein
MFIVYVLCEAQVGSKRWVAKGISSMQGRRDEEAVGLG